LTELIDELASFLGGVKTAESLSPELRKRITVQTGLEAALASALAAGRNVVIAGSAGGGKTHLLQSLAESASPKLPKIVEWPEESDPKGPFIRLVSDATALQAGRRKRIFESMPRNCRASAVAINEGPLLDLARKLPESPFAKAVTLLHAAQRGIKQYPDAKLPTVLDVGGYDPIQNKVISQLLALPVLDELVSGLRCKCDDPRICPRKLAWTLLSDPRVRDRVNDVLQIVNLMGRSILFRELWDFVADLAVGGDCQDDPPTSPWFWRVFYGRSILSGRLLAIADPALSVFPRAESHAWYGDWQSEQLGLLQGLQFIPLAGPTPPTAEGYRWLKSEMFFVLAFPSILEVVRDQVDLELTEAVTHNRPEEIVGAINAYMVYRTLEPSETQLSLWTDMGMERRMDRARGQVALGNVRTTDLKVQRSFTVVNHPDPKMEVAGSAHFLVHEQSDASFGLSREALNLLRGGRSYRSSDRPHTDMEWHLSRFFSDIASTVDSSDRLDVMELEFEAMSARRRSYRLSRALSKIEPTGGTSGIE
jgi:hypothetical protein